VQKIKCCKILLITYLAHKRHKILWRHMKLFSVERKHWTLFHNMYASNSNKIQQEIISKVGDVFIFYHIVLTDMLDFKNSIWRLLRTWTLMYDMSIVDLMANISQWKTCYIIIALEYLLFYFLSWYVLPFPVHLIWEF
jgi:hypothetical protein